MRKNPRLTLYRWPGRRPGRGQKPFLRLTSLIVSVRRNHDPSHYLRCLSPQTTSLVASGLKIMPGLRKTLIPYMRTPRTHTEEREM